MDVDCLPDGRQGGKPVRRRASCGPVRSGDGRSWSVSSEDRRGCYLGPTMSDPRVDEVISFWLGPSGESGEARMQRWFGGGDDLDREIRERFGDLVRAAQAGELGAWER